MKKTPFLSGCGQEVPWWYGNPKQVHDCDTDQQTEVYIAQDLVLFAVAAINIMTDQGWLAKHQLLPNRTDHLENV